MKSHYHALLALALLPTAAQAETYAAAQTAGFAGVAALGAGISGGSAYASYGMDALVGYVPAHIGGEDIWSGTVRFRLGAPLWELGGGWAWTAGYLGVQGFVTNNDDNFVKLPAKYPKAYYPSTATHWGPLVGSEVHWHNIGIYAELSTIDTYLEQRTLNSRELSLWDVVSLGIGARFYLP